MTNENSADPVEPTTDNPSHSDSTVQAPSGGRGTLSEAEQEALKHIWDWFSLHSAQRMQLLSYFFVAVGLIIAGYGTSLTGGSAPAAIGLCVAGVLLTIVFALADVRTKNLVKAAEGPLTVLQSRLGETASLTGANLLERVETARPRSSSYTNVIRLLLATVALLFVAGAVYAAKSDVSAGKSRHWHRHDMIPGGHDEPPKSARRVGEHGSGWAKGTPAWWSTAGPSKSV